MRGPPLSPWQVSVSFDQAHNLIVELEKVNMFESLKVGTIKNVNIPRGAQHPAAL